MEQSITKIIKNEDGLEREISIYPFQILDFFDVLIFDKNNLSIQKQNKKGELSNIDIQELTNIDFLDTVNKEIVFDSLLFFIKNYAKDNNMRICLDEEISYIVDINFLENIQNITHIENKTNFITEQNITVTYENEIFKNLISFLEDFFENKNLDKKERFNKFTSREISVLKKDILLCQQEKERDKIQFNLQKLDFEKKLRLETESKIEEIIKEHKKVLSELNSKLDSEIKNINSKDLIINQYLEDKENLEHIINIKEEELVHCKEELSAINSELSSFKKKSVLPILFVTFLSGLIIGSITFLSLITYSPYKQDIINQIDKISIDTNSTSPLPTKVLEINSTN